MRWYLSEFRISLQSVHEFCSRDAFYVSCTESSNTRFCEHVDCFVVVFFEGECGSKHLDDFVSSDAAIVVHIEETKGEIHVILDPSFDKSMKTEHKLPARST